MTLAEAGELFCGWQQLSDCSDFVTDDRNSCKDLLFRINIKIHFLHTYKCHFFFFSNFLPSLTFHIPYLT